ncbi:MAG: S9 family peptidase [Candidatus Dormibacteraceae bacterium]
MRAERYEPKGEAAQPPRRIDRLFSRLNGEGWTIDRPTQVFVVDAEGASAPRQLTEGPDSSGPLAWSPDSRLLAFVSARQEDADLRPVDDIWTVDVTAAGEGKPEPVRLTQTEAAHLGPAFSPDGRRLAYLAERVDVGYRHVRLHVLQLEDGSVRQLASDLDRSLFPYGDGRAPVWDGDDLLTSVEDRGSVHVLRIAASGTLTRPVAGRRVVTGWDLAGGTLAFTATDATHPTELFTLIDGSERQLTHHQEAFSAAAPPLPPERFLLTAGDGQELDAWILRPPGFDPAKRYPALLPIHGGPATQYGERWFDEFQFLAGAGFVLFWTNPRGASGVTEAFGRAIISPKSAVDPGTGWGGVDYRDLMELTDAALEREPAIDPGRLGVLGGSYGGYMTSWVVTQTHRFAAACSERAVNNLLSEDWSSDGAGIFHLELGVDPLEDPEEYLRMSPIAHVKDVTTPLLILHSEDDLRCPIEQADCLFVALRRLKRDVEYYRFPAENHDLSRSGSPKHRVQRANLLVEFFQRRLHALPEAATSQ